MRTFLTVFFVVIGVAVPTGCSSKAPPIHPVTGKVTFGGKSYSRLLVYFRPTSGVVNEFGTNLAVGETDKDGNLTILSATGPGLQTGSYKVTFALYEQVKGNRAVTGSDKPDELGAQMKQVIPAPYDDETSREKTPVDFRVSSGSNEFVFDLPK
jgi:hypothetical protein